MNKDRLYKLCWTILEAKYIYYKMPEGIKPMSDDRYDSLEDEYKILCKRLNILPSASDMVGFDTDRPSCKLVVENVHKKDFKFTIDK